MMMILFCVGQLQAWGRATAQGIRAETTTKPLRHLGDEDEHVLVASSTLCTPLRGALHLEVLYQCYSGVLSLPQRL